MPFSRLKLAARYKQTALDSLRGFILAGILDKNHTHTPFCSDLTLTILQPLPLRSMPTQLL